MKEDVTLVGKKAFQMFSELDKSHKDTTLQAEVSWLPYVPAGE